MIKDYFKELETLAEYNAFITTSIKPNVSWVAENNSVHYGNYPPTHDYSQDYLTFNIVSSGTINWMACEASNNKTISYSTDSGSTWTDITSTTGGTSFNVNAGDKVLFKGDNETYCHGRYAYNSFTGSTAKFEAEGNIMSLINSTGFTTATTLTSAMTFQQLFSNCNIVSAENLVLPATTLANDCYCSMFSLCSYLVKAPKVLPAITLVENCYGSMFYHCNSLETSPELPALILTNYCYESMFDYCPSLNYVKCLATDITASHCTNNWLRDTANSGTFVKNSLMTGWTSGDSGIPTGWTVEDAS